MKKFEDVIEKIEKIESLKNEVKNIEKEIRSILDRDFFDPFFENKDIIAVAWEYYLPEHDYNDPRGFIHGELNIMHMGNLDDSQKSELGNDGFYKEYNYWVDADYLEEVTLRKISNLFKKISTDLHIRNFNYGDGLVVITREKVMFFSK